MSVFVETQHPRDWRGRFVEKVGGERMYASASDVPGESHRFALTDKQEAFWKDAGPNQAEVMERVMGFAPEDAMRADGQQLVVGSYSDGVIDAHGPDSAEHTTLFRLADMYSEAESVNWNGQRLFERDQDRASGDSASSVVTSGDTEAAIASAANRILETASQAEPAVSQAIQEIAERNDANLEGFDFRLKGKDSMMRKIRKKLAEKPSLSPSEADKTIKDAVRYTMTVRPERYAGALSEVFAELRRQGFEFSDSDIKNSWPKDSLYKGINLNARRGGITMELQFHTPESFDVKQNRTHSLYEEARLPTTSPQRVEELRRQMERMFADIPVPDGVANVGRQVRH